eukprot:1351525-Amorphochlora_amoeboformis.AAC.2
MASKNRTRNVLIVSMPKSENLTSRFLRGHAAVIEQKIKNGDKLKVNIASFCTLKSRGLNLCVQL